MRAGWTALGFKYSTLLDHFAMENTLIYDFTDFKIVDAQQILLNRFLAKSTIMDQFEKGGYCKKLRKLSEVFMETIHSMYDDVYVSIPLTLSYLLDHCYSELGVRISWSQTETPREECTMSRFSRSKDEVASLKSNRVGSNDARYFRTPLQNTSKDKVLEKLGWEEFTAGEDKDLAKILKSENKPDIFCDLKIQTNSKVFYNDNFNRLCCTPDGIAFIDGILCPVELHTTKVAMQMVSNSKSGSVKKMLKGENNKIEVLSKHVKEKIHLKHINKKKKSTRNEDPPFSPSRESAKTNKAKSDIDQDRSRSRHRSISILSGPYSEDKFEARSDGQSSRMVINLFHFQEASIETMPNDKKAQLQTQMACMRAHKGVLIDWREDGIHFCIVDRLKTTYSDASAMNSNISSNISNRNIPFSGF